MKKKKRNSRTQTKLSKHKHRKKILSPPLSELKNVGAPVSMTSWMSERMPDLLWAALLISNTERRHYIIHFKILIKKHVDLGIEYSPNGLSLGALSKLSTAQFCELFDIEGANNDAIKRILSPLLLFDTLPGKENWKAFIGDIEPSIDSLAIAISKNYDHSSIESTDCRWAKLYLLLAQKRLQFPEKLLYLAEGIAFYPEKGDQRKIRPAIRATEGSFSALDQDSGEMESWSPDFWRECMLLTPCQPMSSAHSQSCVTSISADLLNVVYKSLIEHFHSTNRTTDIDEKHDSIFGLALYSISILHNIIGNTQNHIGRILTRSIVEIYINMKYMIKSNDQEAWKKFRNYGRGQSKLNLLKFEESEDTPEYIDISMLSDLANDDFWQEYLDINIGHWDNKDLRKMAIECGAKKIYDDFYPLNSSFSHGHWNALRETVFTLCINPLHRFHRIPKRENTLPSIGKDACKLVDEILGLLDSVYPSFPHRVSIVEQS